MSEKLCLQWNGFKENVNSLLGQFRGAKEFTDVTLACEDGQQLEAHKIILAASCSFFESIFQRSKDSHPWIYLRGFHSNDLLPILDFMYFGEASIDQENLDSFLTIGEELNLKGLAAQELKLKTGKFSNGGAEVEEQAMFKSVQKVEKMMTPEMEVAPRISGYVNKSQTTTSKESPKKSTINNKYMKPNPDDLQEDSTVFTRNGDVEALDGKVKSLMQKSQNMVSNGPLMKTTAFICKVCGKEGRPTQIRDHIEANHLDDIALPCDKILAISGATCGKTFSGRRGLIKHKTRLH